MYNVITWFHCVSILRASSDQISYPGFPGTLFDQQAAIVIRGVEREKQDKPARPPPVVRLGLFLFLTIVVALAALLPRTGKLAILYQARSGRGKKKEEENGLRPHTEPARRGPGTRIPGQSIRDPVMRSEANSRKSVPHANERLFDIDLTFTYCFLAEGFETVDVVVGLIGFDQPLPRYNLTFQGSPDRSRGTANGGRSVSRQWADSSVVDRAVKGPLPRPGCRSVCGTISTPTYMHGGLHLG